MNSPTDVNAAGFGVFNLDPALLNALRKSGYDEPRPIQSEAIPPVIAGRDVLGLAQTGTGKTAAFGLPLLQRLLENPGPGPRALILAPTRELAIQIDKEIRTLARGTRIRTVTVYGGVSERPQIQTLRKRPEIVVGCPGRFLDLLQRGEVNVKKIDTLILDEADHMFDMGFLPDIRRIISRLPEKRQNLLFAATMPKDLRKLTNQILVDPLVAELAHSKPAETIEHALYPVQQKRKLALLQHLLKLPSFFSSIVFTRTKHRANRLARQLKNSGLRAIAIQGNMTQGARDRAMKGFRDCRFDVLVATDIVARGIDVDQVSHVINYDVPDTVEAYTHRIGRTGRSEREGRAYTFVTENDLLAIEDIERKLGLSIERLTIEGFEGLKIPLPTRRQRRDARETSGRRRGGNQRRQRPSQGRPRNRRSGDSRFESRGSGKPRHNSRRSDDSRFESRGSGKPRHNSRRSNDSRF
ncbi:MAG: DEAD/DEAH box helicase, partial [Planctomycetes bacterium]|nr:DEAD/DEAH box helicase [Planctomycetota bacterium]